MKKYGLRIGDVGIEFITVEDRAKAISDFTKGSVVRIHDMGVRYQEDSRAGSFSVYDRDTNEVITCCRECGGTFSIDSCPKREYPRKYSYEKEFSTMEDHICDACYAVAVKKKKVFDAEKVL